MIIKVLENDIYRFEPSVLIITKNKNILVNTPQTFDKYLKEKVDVVYFTHGHPKNIEGISKVKKYIKLNSLIPCYCSNITKHHIKRIWEEAEQYLDFKTIEPYRKNKFGIIPLPCTHIVQQGYDFYGFIINDIAFITPVYNLTEKSLKLVNNCKYIITGVRYIRLTKYQDNQSLTQILKRYRKSKVEKIILLGVSKLIKKDLPFKQFRNGEYIDFNQIVSKEEFIKILMGILKMPLSAINRNSIKKVSDKELLSLHLRMHQLYSLWRAQGRSVKVIYDKHMIIVKEMLKRGWKGCQVKDKLGSDTRRELTRGEILDYEFIKIVGSYLYSDKPADIDVLVNLRRYNKKISEILEREIANNIPLHLIYGKRKPHGSYKVIGTLVFKMGKPYSNEFEIKRIGAYRLCIRLNKNYKIRAPEIQPHYFKPFKYYEKTSKIKSMRYVMEPRYKDDSLVFIHKEGNKLKYYHKEKLPKEFVRDLINIKTYNDYILAGVKTKTKIYLIDILAKEEADLSKDFLIDRKHFLRRVNLERCSYIKFMPFLISKKKNVKKLLMINKLFRQGAVIRGTLSGPSDSRVEVNYPTNLKVDLGCGSRKVKDFIGIDKNIKSSADIFYDLEKGIPLQDDSCSLVVMRHFAEHHSNPNLLMKEVYRVIKNRGKIYIEVPEASTWGAKNYPDHKSFWDIKLIKEIIKAYSFKILQFKRKIFYRLNYKDEKVKCIYLKVLLEAIKKGRGEGQGQGGPRQGDGGNIKCICPKCGYKVTKPRGVPCTKIKCCKCGTPMVAEEVGYPSPKASDKKKSIDFPIPEKENKPDLSDRMIESVLQANIFNQSKIEKIISPYKVALYSKAIKELLRGRKIKIIDLKWNNLIYKPATFDLLETNRDKKERLLVKGYILIKGKIPMVIHYRPDFMCQIFSMYCRKEHLKYIENFFKQIEKYIKKYNYWKGEKITPFGKFLPLSGITKSDIILENTTMERIDKTIFNFFNNKERYIKAGVSFKRGVIFEGLPGTGKTLVGRIIMNNMPNITFIWVTAKDLMKFNKESKVDYLFEMARELQPSILFIEDVDRALKEGPTLDIIKTQMDGLECNDGILTILSTNFPDKLPKTLIDRPGRFDDVIEFNLPSARLRYQILLYYSKNINIKDKKITLAKIAKMSKGLTPAHLKEIIISAYMGDNKEELTFYDLRNSLHRIQRIHGRFKHLKAFEPLTRFDPPKTGKGYFAQEFADIETFYKVWAKGFLDQDIPLAVERKYNGWRTVAQKKGDRYLIYFRKKENKEKIFPDIKTDLDKLGNVILDCDLGAIGTDGKPLPRAELAFFNTSKVPIRTEFTTPGGVKGKLRVNVFDILFYKGESLIDRPYEERRKILEKAIKGLSITKISEMKKATNKSTLISAIDSMSKKPGSEGAVVKSFDSKYNIKGNIPGWAKIKIILEIKVEVEKVIVNRAGNYNYDISCEGKKEKVMLGRTMNTNVKAKVGDILTLTVEEVIPRFNEKAGQWEIAIVIPRVRDVATEVSKSESALAIIRRAYKFGVLEVTSELLNQLKKEGILKSLSLEKVVEARWTFKEGQKIKKGIFQVHERGLEPFHIEYSDFYGWKPVKVSIKEVEILDKIVPGAWGKAIRAAMIGPSSASLQALTKKVKNKYKEEKMPIAVQKVMAKVDPVSIHTDLRMQGEEWDYFEGAQLFQPGNQFGTNPLLEIKEKDAMGAIKAPHKDAEVPKEPVIRGPLSWMVIGDIKPYVAKPGEVGATKNTYGRLKIVGHFSGYIGKISDTKHYYEFYWKFREKAIPSGRYVWIYAKFNGRRQWLLKYPKKQHFDLEELEERIYGKKTT